MSALVCVRVRRCGCGAKRVRGRATAASVRLRE